MPRKRRLPVLVWVIHPLPQGYAGGDGGTQ